MSLGECLTVAAYLVGAGAFWMAARRRQMASEGIAYLALAALVGGVIGAKIGEWAVANGAAWAAHPFAILEVRGGGRSILGGVLGGWIAVEIAKKRLGIRRSTGDLWALALPWGEAVGRIGCWFNGCCFGAPWSGPCAVWQHEAWRFPAQFLSSACAFAIGCFLWWPRKETLREGQLWHWYLMGWGACRVGIEFVRNHPSYDGMLSSAQWTALVILTIGVVLWRRDRERYLNATMPV